MFSLFFLSISYYCYYNYYYDYASRKAATSRRTLRETRQYFPRDRKDSSPSLPVVRRTLARIQPIEFWNQYYMHTHTHGTHCIHNTKYTYIHTNSLFIVENLNDLPLLILYIRWKKKQMSFESDFLEHTRREKKRQRTRAETRTRYNMIHTHTHTFFSLSLGIGIFVPSVISVTLKKKYERSILINK